jgi:hypothetical protein
MKLLYRCGVTMPISVPVMRNGAVRCRVLLLLPPAQVVQVYAQVHMARWSMRFRRLARYGIRQFCEFGLQTSHVCLVNVLPPGAIFCQSEFIISE